MTGCPNKLSGLAAILCFALLSLPAKSQAPPASGQQSKPELVLETGHSDNVLTLSFSPDGRWLATGGNDHAARIWDVSTGDELRVFSHDPDGNSLSQPISSVAFSPNPREALIALGMGGFFPEIWDASTAKFVKYLGREFVIDSTFQQQFGSVAMYVNFQVALDDHLGFTPDGAVLAEGRGHAIVLWDVASGRYLQVLPSPTCGITAMTFNRDGQELAAGCQDGTIIVWKLGDHVQQERLSSHTAAVSAIAFSADGKLLASGGQDKKIVIWETATWHNTATIASKDADARALAFSPDGNSVISGDSDSKIRYWDIRTGVNIRTIEGHTGPLTAIALSGDGRQFASASMDHTAKLWETATGAELRDFASRLDWVLQLVFSPDAHWLAWGGLAQVGRTTSSAAGAQSSSNPVVPPLFRSVHLWNLDSGILLRSLTSRASNVADLAFSADVTKLVTSDIFQTTTWQSPLWTETSPFDMQNGPGGQNYAGEKLEPAARWVADYRLNDSAIRIFDTTTGKILQSIPLQQPEGLELKLAISKDAHWLAWHTLSGEFKTWDVEHRRPGPAIPASSAGADSFDFVGKFQFSPDDRWLVWNTTRQLRLLNIQSNRQEAPLITLNPAEQAGTVLSFVFSKDGTKFVAVTGRQSIGVYETSTWRQIRQLHCNLAPMELFISPDGKILTGINLQNVEFWDLSTGREVLPSKLDGHEMNIEAGAFTSDGSHFFTGSRDGTARVWDPATGELLAILISLPQENSWLVATPDGLFDGSPDAWTQMLWRFNGSTADVLPVEAFFNENYYPGLLTEILAGKRPKAADITQKDRRQPGIKLSRIDPPGPASSGASRVARVRLEITEAPADKDHTSGSGVRDVRLFRNGSLVKMWHGVLPIDAQGRTVLEDDVTIVAGENHLTAYAFNNDNIKSSDRALTITGVDALKRKGIAYILAIGVNHYSNPDFDLQYAVPDADLFAQELKQHQEKLDTYERVEVVPLRDERATRENILAALSNLAGTAQPEDAVFVFYAGHGIAEGPRFYLIPHDLGYSGPRSGIDDAALKLLSEHGISDEDLETAFEKIDAGQTVLVIDACNSGQALEAEEKRRGPMNSKGLAQLAYEKGMYILTASQSFQAAHEISELGHGVLTYALVDQGLEEGRAKAADGNVYVRPWLDYAVQEVPHLQTEWLSGTLQSNRGPVPEGDTSIRAGLQSPRVFYRREPEANPLVIGHAKN